MYFYQEILIYFMIFYIATFGFIIALVSPIIIGNSIIIPLYYFNLKYTTPIFGILLSFYFNYFSANLHNLLKNRCRALVLNRQYLKYLILSNYLNIITWFMILGYFTDVVLYQRLIVEIWSQVVLIPVLYSGFILHDSLITRLSILVNIVYLIFMTYNISKYRVILKIWSHCRCFRNNYDLLSEFLVLSLNYLLVDLLINISNYKYFSNKKKIYQKFLCS